MNHNAIPDDRSYTEEHEWIDLLPGSDVPTTPVRVGITALAVEALGDLVYVDLPEPGTDVLPGESCGEVESTKTVTELFPPVSGQVVEVNTAAVDDPGIVTNDPYGDGWLFAILPSATGNLLSAVQYVEQTEGAA